MSSGAMDNLEIAMRVSSSIKSEDTFYTDLNGFQMIKRRRYSKLPLQANFYPVASMVYIQDNKTRLSIMSRQPMGGTSVGSGQVELMQDRRLEQDDHRGLRQGVLDNRVTQLNMVLLVETQAPGCKVEPGDSQASYPSLVGLGIRHSLLNPLYRLLYLPDHNQGNYLNENYTTTAKDLPQDIHIINLRTMLKDNQDPPSPSDSAVLVLHRQGFTACYPPWGMRGITNGGKIKLEDIFPKLYSTIVKQMSLTLMYDGMTMEKSYTVSIQPMEMYSFLLEN